MNQSGKSIKSFADFCNIETGNILIIHDDIDLAVGRTKLVRNGGAGGHKGVLSIIKYLGTNAFPRVKVGIGRPRYMEPVDEYVLSPFYGDEKEAIEKVIQIAFEACVLFIFEGVESAMNFTNCQHITTKEEKN
jgi:PTH1 family peptidyl-tRNA hydrolase